MSHILTFNDIFSSDSKKVGLIATRLADFFQNSSNVEIGFVLTTDLFNEFMESNNLFSRIKTLLLTIDTENISRLLEINTQIREMILKAVFSEELKETIIDSYEGLGIDLENTSTETLVENYEKPAVNVFLSPVHESGFVKNALVMNVMGEHQLFKAIKEVIISLYSPEMIKIRENLGKEHDISNAIIIQKMVIPDVSGYALSKNPENSDDSKVFIASEFGIGGLIDSEVAQDKFLIDKESLKIVSSDIKTKDYALTIIDKKFEKKRLKEIGEEQSLNDKQITEIARFVKKIKKPLVIFWYVLNEKIYCQRIVELISNNIKLETKELQSNSEIQNSSNLETKEIKDFSASKPEGLETKELQESSEIQNSSNLETKELQNDSELKKSLEVPNYVEEEQELDYDEKFDVDSELGINEDKISMEEDLNVLDQLESEFGFETPPKKIEPEQEDSIINVATEPVPSKESFSKNLLDKASDSASSSIIFLHLAIVNKLKEAYYNLYGAEPSSDKFSFLLESVNEQETLNNIESLKKVDFYNSEYLSGKSLDLEELREAIQITLEFVK